MNYLIAHGEGIDNGGEWECKGQNPEIYVHSYVFHDSNRRDWYKGKKPWLQQPWYFANLSLVIRWVCWASLVSHRSHGTIDCVACLPAPRQEMPWLWVEFLLCFRPNTYLWPSHIKGFMNQLKGGFVSVWLCHLPFGLLVGPWPEKTATSHPLSTFLSLTHFFPLDTRVIITPIGKVWGGKLLLWELTSAFFSWELTLFRNIFK